MDEIINGTSFELTIALGGDAMATAEDIAEQLRAVANRLEAAGQYAHTGIKDTNGNTVGSWSIQ